VQSSQDKNKLNVQFSDFAERFKSLFGTDNAAQIARELNKQHSTINNYCKGVRLPEPEMLIEIAQLTNVSLSWLLTGRGPKHVSEEQHGIRNGGAGFTPDDSKTVCLPNVTHEIVSKLARQTNKPLAQTVQDLLHEALIARGLLRDRLERHIELFEVEGFEFFSVPVAGEVAAGSPIRWFQEVTEYVDIPAQYKKYGDRLMVLRVRGDSMIDDQLEDGDLAICIRQDFYKDGQMIVAEIDGEESTVKRYRRDGDKVILEPRNAEYQPMTYHQSRVQIKGLVVGLLRQFVKL
jgi:SOS regulatory protein LexA